jgi:hypothetical protein
MGWIKKTKYKKNVQVLLIFFLTKKLNNLEIDPI